MAIGFAQLLLVAAGGALGGIARYWVNGAVTRRLSGTFPWGTLIINVTGSTAIGLLAAIFSSPELSGGGRAASFSAGWNLLAIGVLGSYTTVSTFSLQTMALLQDGDLRSAVTNIAASIGLCLFFLSLGYGMAGYVVPAGS